MAPDTTPDVPKGAPNRPLIGAAMHPAACVMPAFPLLPSPLAEFPVPPSAATCDVMLGARKQKPLTQLKPVEHIPVAHGLAQKKLTSSVDTQFCD